MKIKSTSVHTDICLKSKHELGPGFGPKMWCPQTDNANCLSCTEMHLLLL